jgi:60 kDa SS-A/Ro ribonucleoprotein
MEKAGWHMLRMNLNTFDRQCVFAIDGMAEIVAKRLADPEAIRRAKVFPYQLMAAHAMAGQDIPRIVIAALEAAMEMALANVPAISGQVVVCPDVSGSMASPVTGFRKGATTAVRCIDVAALVAAAVKRKNPWARILPFEQEVVDIDIDPEASVMTNAARLASIGGGGTNCSAPIQQLVKERAAVDLVILVSDNESWVDAGRGRGTALMQEWQALKRNNPQAKLVCIDIQPYSTTQAHENIDILNIGGFSDNVFEVVAKFADGTLDADHWKGEIEKIPLQLEG